MDVETQKLLKEVPYEFGLRHLSRGEQRKLSHCYTCWVCVTEKEPQPSIHRFHASHNHPAQLVKSRVLIQEM